MADVFKKSSLFPLLTFILLTASLNALTPTSTITQQDIDVLKGYADSFNQSRNYPTRFGPAEQVCWTQGTFLAYHPCHDYATCLETANLVCSVNEGQACDINLLAAAILEYKIGVDHLNSAYSNFMEGYDSYGTITLKRSLDFMDDSFDEMQAAADEVSQSKLRFPELIPCPCDGNPAACCIGRCPEARFNYTAISLGQSEISELRLKRCIDGTRGGQCSATLPKECVTGQLFDNALRCGCPPLMRPAANGKTCEFIPCNDNGISVPSGTCSPNKEKKCVEGVLVNLASECGCPPGKIRENETCVLFCSDGTREGECSLNHPLQCINGELQNSSQCACPMVAFQTCSKANATRFHNVTYIFDRGYNKTMNEPYTFEKETCHEVLSTYSGLNCSQLVGNATNSTPIYPPEPEPETVKYVPCDRCPAICTRAPPVNLACGSCACPPNYGFCDTSGMRQQLNNTRIYCGDELLQKQKKDNAICKNNYECRSNLCSSGKCYNPDFLQAMLDWFADLFGIGG